MSSEKIKQQKIIATALNRLRFLKRNSCFDSSDLDSKPTSAQEEVLKDFGKVDVQYILAGNQGGKGATCARQFTWAMNNTHPYWKCPEAWQNEPLLCIVTGVSGKIIEHSILPKLTSLLEETTYKVIRVGNMAQELRLNNGNRFVFQSLENPNEARKRLQAYVAHFFWSDEQPPTLDIMAELEMRIRSKGGFGMYSFTPLVVNLAIKRKVDGASMPFAKKYTFSTLDNPVYKDEKKRASLLAEMELLPRDIRETRLYGAWSPEKSAVYHFDWDGMVRPLPDHYSRSWRHVEVVDPALKSALGLGIFAEDPLVGHWYMVHSEEITGIHDPESLLDTVERKTIPYNIILRVCDPHEVWYMQLAARRNRKYIGVYSKNNRKGELIKGLQMKLGTVLFICPHNSDFIDQVVGCRWADSENSRIVSASSKHMIDVAQYFCDNIPKFEASFIPQPWYTKLYQDNQLRLQAEANKANRRNLNHRRRR